MLVGVCFETIFCMFPQTADSFLGFCLSHAGLKILKYYMHVFHKGAAAHCGPSMSPEIEFYLTGIFHLDSMKIYTSPEAHTAQITI